MKCESLILKGEYQGLCVFFCGRAIEAENWLLDRGAKNKSGGIGGKCLERIEEE